MKSADLISRVLGHRSAMKLLHWKTTGEDIHRIIDMYLENFDEVTDKLVEVVLGDEVPSDEKGKCELSLFINKYDGIIPVVTELRSFKDFIEPYRSQSATYVQNIIDELLASASKTIYLLDKTSSNNK